MSEQFSAQDFESQSPKEKLLEEIIAKYEQEAARLESRFNNDSSDSEIADSYWTKEMDKAVEEYKKIKESLSHLYNLRDV